ncbi:adaptor protein MecA [Anaerobium acetethylicum]|uniref:Negative regulator of genetic competence (MecA) n=1 Tax=Anaerobium acetethylicum TaxID=1619234 RepID=A0A1D3TVN3_9FIRM|nr:adaptor protein MecA [Anaerobium acetethylicum]SCP98213.1 Negative regulator of genetic competence (MecA) [Anaerobium acetethylicum]
MLFFRIDGHTVRCAVPEVEISKMGYDLQELLVNQNTASGFLKEVVARGKEAGFFMDEKLQVVQTAFFSNHYLVLHFSDLNPDEQIDSTIQRMPGRTEEVAESAAGEGAELTADEAERSQKKYLLWFRNLSLTENFCKTAVPVPGKLYRERTRYCLLADLSGLERNAAQGFVFRAQEFVEEIREDSLYTAFLDEHADVIIKENPIEVLKNL